MATETSQTAQVKAGKAEFKEETKSDTPDGGRAEMKVEYKVDRPMDPYSRIARAEALIHRDVMWALGASILPIPVIDIIAVTGVDMKMLRELSNLYYPDVRYQPSLLKKIVFSLLSSVGGLGIGSLVGASLAKLFPVVGTTLGVVSAPIFAGAFTHALGKMFLMHFESGGTLLDFDAHAMHDYFRNEYEKSKDYVSRMQKEESLKARPA